MKRTLDKLLNKMTSMIRRTRVSLSYADTSTYPIAQVSYLGKTGDIEVIWPYGMNGQLPVDAQSFTLNIEGMEENKAGIGTTPTIRLKVDAEGEVSFGNPLTGSVTYYRANGDIETICKNDISVTIQANSDLIIAGNQTEIITGSSAKTATGAVNIVSAASVNLTAPSVNMGASGGTLRALIDERIVALHNAHYHQESGGNSTLAPTVPINSSTVSTTDTKAS